MEESNTSLRLAVEAADFGIWHIHSVTRDFETTQRLRDFFGLGHLAKITIEQAVMQIREDLREYVSKTLENAIYNNGEYDVTYPVIGLNDGKLRWLRAMGRLRADPSGAFSDFIGVVMDISELKKDEQRKNDFIGMVSHELKTPLTSISAYMQYLQMQVKEKADEKLLWPVQRSLNQVKKMTAMVNGFLDLSRFESAQIQLNRENVDLYLLLNEVVADYEAHSLTHKIALDPEPRMMVYADSDKIGQVINNLIGNAIKYSPVQSTILISFRTSQNVAEITVTDQGIGIDEREQLKLFERYYRGENHGTISGFGLGLYLSAEIISRHHGRIWVKSKLGKGSTFHFTLPMASQ